MFSDICSQIQNTQDCIDTSAIRKVIEITENLEGFVFIINRHGELFWQNYPPFSTKKTDCSIF